MSQAYQQKPLFEPMQADISDVLEHMSDSDAEKEKSAWPSTLAEAVDVLAADGEKRGLSAESAVKEAKRTVILLAQYWGGRPIYMPKNDKLRIALRDSQIWLEFKGDNIEALAKKHALTTTMIYIILKKQRALTIARKQKVLFPKKS